MKEGFHVREGEGIKSKKEESVSYTNIPILLSCILQIRLLPTHSYYSRARVQKIK